MRDRFKVKTVPGSIPSAADVETLLEDPDVVDGYDLKFVTPVAAGGGYTHYLLFIFERKK